MPPAISKKMGSKFLELLLHAIGCRYEVHLTKHLY